MNAISMLFSTDITKAANLLQQGKLVAFSTETVYGLGADARNPDALVKIFQAKQRPIDHPLIVHIADLSQLSEWASDVSESAKLLANAFWPGPLTLILNKAPGVSDLVTGNQSSIGIRIPSHPMALALLKAFGGGVAAPSANRFGRISPTTAEAVYEELGDSVDLILDGGSCDVGVESTIIDVSGETPTMLRPGMITVDEIEKVLNQSVNRHTKEAPRVSGSLESHYAPQTKTRLISPEEVAIFFQQLAPHDLPLVLLTRTKVEFKMEHVHCINMPQHAKEYAHDLYHLLRKLDKEQFQQILVETVPNDVTWDAVRDRLKRASSK